MAFVKTVKNNAYFKRYQTKYRRRREGKTDYYARKRLIIQDKDKYNTPKYRLVVRTTCSKVLCQIIYATLSGDRVLCQARSDELKKFGLTAGLTNYASHYATGLLIARRLLKQLKLDETYKGADKITGEEYNVEDVEADKRPFKAVLDIGLVHTTTGKKTFGTLKGAIDGGLLIPYSEKRFPGFAPGEEAGDDGNYDAKVHRERIFGAHVDKYMTALKEEDQEAFKKQFNKWNECLQKNGAKSVEALMTKVFAAIRKDPVYVKSNKKVNPSERKHRPLDKRLTKEQRTKRSLKKIKALFKAKKQ